MGTVEIGVTLLSFIWVLALTHVLECLRDLWSARDRVKASASQLIWIAAILVFIVMSWLPLAELGDRLRGSVFLVLLIYAIAMFFTAAMVSPKVPESGELDLAQYEDREGPAYKLGLISLMILSIWLNWVLASAGGAPQISTFLASQWFVMAMAGASVGSMFRQPHALRAIWALLVLALGVFVLLGNVGVLDR